MTLNPDPMQHISDHVALQRHPGDPLAPSTEERVAIKERLFHCHYGGYPCVWQPTSEDRERRELIHVGYLYGVAVRESS